MPKTDIVEFNVHVYDGNNNASSNYVYAQICVQDWSGTTGGGCGSGDQTSGAGTGSDTLNPSLSELTANDFGYIYVQLPPSDVGFSGIKGWYFDNN